MGYAGRNEIFSREVVEALAAIWRFISLVIIEEIWTLAMSGPDEDNPGAPILLALLVIFTWIVVATTAGMFPRILQTAVDLKSENDFSV